MARLQPREGAPPREELQAPLEAAGLLLQLRLQREGGLHPAIRPHPRLGHFNDDTTGVTQDAAKILAEKIKILLPIDCRPLVTDVPAGRLLNSRISLRIRDGGEQCWVVKRKIDEALAATPLMIRGHRVYAMVESPPAVRLKNRILAVAIQVSTTNIGELRAAHLKKDYRAGTLYNIVDLEATNPNYIPIGKLKRDNSWKWMKEALSSTFPTGTPERLDELLAAALADE